MSRWLGAMLLAVIMVLAASGPAAAQADDRSALVQQFREFMALYSEGKYTEAATTIGERVLKFTEQEHGSHAPATAPVLNNLAVVYNFQGRYEEALKALGRALAINEKVLGPEHPHVAQTLNNLAILDVGQRNWAEAQRNAPPSSSSAGRRSAPQA